MSPPVFTVVRRGAIFNAQDAAGISTVRLIAGKAEVLEKPRLLTTIVLIGAPRIKRHQGVEPLIPITESPHDRYL